MSDQPFAREFEDAASSEGGVPLHRPAEGPPPAVGEDLHLSAHPAVFTPARQVRFLDQLAITGNARLSAARAGVSHETAYRQRRRSAEFARLWVAALVHARRHAEDVLADRALEGVTEDVWYRGEVVGQRVRYDTRLLLAHLARLDRLVAEEPAAVADAERFEPALAALAGHPSPEGFAEAAGLFERRPPEPGELDRPPTRREYAAWHAGEAIEAALARAAAETGDGLPGRLAEDEEADVLAAAREAGAGIWDRWHAGVVAAVDAAVDAALPGAPRAAAPDPVNGVNPGCGAAPGPRPEGPRAEGDAPAPNRPPPPVAPRGAKP